MTAIIISFESKQRIPDPRNGEVWATECFDCTYDGNVEVQTPAGFDVIHMSQSGSSFGYIGNFDTMAEAQEAARLYAAKINAVYVP